MNNLYIYLFISQFFSNLIHDDDKCRKDNKCKDKCFKNNFLKFH